MCKRLAVAIVAALSVSALPHLARAADDATLSVTGHAQITRAPDLATVALTIVTTDDVAARAFAENNRRFAALGMKLAANGISGNAIRSASIQSYFNPRPAAAAAGMTGPFGFSVTRNVQIDIVLPANAGGAIDAATAAGATQIEGVSYGLRDRRAVERAALAAAVADANAQAQAIAAAAHVVLVRILRIGDEVAPRPVAPMLMGAMARNSVAPAPTTIAPSDLEVEGSITVTYAIRQ